MLSVTSNIQEEIAYRRFVREIRFLNPLHTCNSRCTPQIYNFTRT